MKPVVIDASMAVAWVLPDERSDLADSILREVEGLRRMTTALFWYEYRNILVSNYKRNRLTDKDVPKFLMEISALEIEEYSQSDHAWIISLAIKHRLSAYDAAYLALAVKEGAILATNDRRLVQAAFAEGVELCTALERIGEGPA